MSKRILSLLLAVVLCLSLLPTAALATEGDSNQMPAYSGGTGTEDDPWLISSVEDLKTLAETINSGAAAAYDTESDEVGNYHGYYFMQTADLDLSGIANWESIGYSSSSRYFAGHYDGNGHTISGAKSTGKNDDDGFATAGIFGWVAFGSVKNLTVEDADFRATGKGEYSYVGGIAAVAFSSTIQNCAVRNSKLDSRRKPDLNTCTGGIAGYSTGSAFSNCASIANEINSQMYAGGFVGENDDDNDVGDSTYTNCYVADCSVKATTQTVNGSSFAGGFIGMVVADEVALTNCYTYKTVLSTEETAAHLNATGVFAAYFFTNDYAHYAASIKTQNCYYGECGITNNAGSAVVKTAEEFTNGTVASALGDAFAQGKDYPVFATDPADYTAVDAAIAKANALNKTDYTDFSAVESAVNAVVRGKTIAEQSQVNAMAQAIEDAIAALEKNLMAAVVSGGTTTGYATLAAALAAATDGDTVKLLADEKVGDTITVSGGDITLDLNGHFSYRTLVLESGAALTVVNNGGSEDSWLTSVKVKTGGSLTMDNGGYVDRVYVNEPNAKLAWNEGATVAYLDLNGSGLLVADCIPQGCYLANADNGDVYNGDALTAADVNTSHGVKVHPIPSEITVTAREKTGSISLDGIISADLFPTVTTGGSAPQLTYSWYRRTDGGVQLAAWVKQNEDGSYAYQEITYNPPVFTEGETFDALCVVTAMDANGVIRWATPVTGYSMTVAKGPATVSSVPAAVESLTYNGSAQALVTAGTAAGGTMLYSTEPNGTYSEKIPTGTNAGDYTVWYYVKGDANHGDSLPASVTVTIAKADFPHLTGKLHSQKYTMTTEQTISLADALSSMNMPDDAGTLTYAKGEVQHQGGSSTVVWNVNADGIVTYTITNGTVNECVTLPVTVSSSNYADTRADIRITLTDRDTPEVTANAITVTYDGSAVSAEKITGTAAFNGNTVEGTWSWAENQSLTNVSDSGEKTVVFTPADSVNYKPVDTKVSLTIHKATPTGAPKYTAITQSGRKLSDAALTVEGGTFSVPGTVKWVDANGADLSGDTEVKANTSYKWAFTPADEANYNEIGGSVTLYSVSSSGGGGGSSTTTTKTETTTNPDGSVTKTETKSDGTVIETTTNKDGSTTKTETKKDGSSKTEIKDASGSTGTVNTDKNGNTTAEAKITDKAISDAKKSDEAVKIPAEVKVGEDSASAPTVKIDLPSSAGETKIEIPVKDVNSGTVAIIVKPDGTEEIVKDSVPTKDGIQLTVSGDVTVKLVDNAKGFTDIGGHWAEDSIDFVSARGLVNGTSSTTFSPDAPTTRAQLWTILARQANADLTGGASWYEKAQAWAKESGISDGFNPDGTITRAQMVTMLWRAAGSPEVTAETVFTDVPAGSYYAKAVAWAVERGITTGVGNGKFAPDDACTRAQVAAFLHRSYLSK